MLYYHVLFMDMALELCGKSLFSSVYCIWIICHTFKWIIIMLVTTFVHCLCNNSATCVTCNCAPNYSGLYFSMTLTTAPHCLVRKMQHVCSSSDSYTCKCPQRQNFDTWDLTVTGRASQDESQRGVVCINLKN